MMIIDVNKTYSILTGDVVGSKKVKGTDRELLHACFESAGQKMLDSFSEFVPYPPEFFRGDSWQFLVTDPAMSLRIGIFFRALIKACMQKNRNDTRISIGLGSIEFLPAGRVSSGDGDAFRLSGGGLDRIHKPERMGIFFPAYLESDVTRAVEVIVKLIDLKVKEWTGKQARAISGALLGLTQASIARDWFNKEVTQQAVGQHLDRAGYATIALAIEYFESQLPVILDR